ncbi:MAG: sel1 repeat family protein [Rhodobacterales bacterium]|nr:sel1 repeat family protein [Rhodobacterales bacterium]
MRVFPALILILLLAMPARADYAAGKRAYDAGDYPTALAELRPAAEAGDPRAQLWLARLYFRGHGTPVDYPAALTWFRKAATQFRDMETHRQAVYGLGYMVEDGLGIRANPRNAACLYRVAADAGLPSAQWALCSVVPRNSALFNEAWADLSLDMCHRAARQGEPHALNYLAGIFLWNPLTPDEKGYMYYALAAQRGHAAAKEKVAEFQATLKGRKRRQFEAGVEQAKAWQATEEPAPTKPVPLDPSCQR